MRGCGFVDDAPAAHRGACRGQLFELPTAHPFDHKLHSHLLCSMKRSQKPENHTLKLQSKRATPAPVMFTGMPVTMPESPVTIIGIRNPSGAAAKLLHLVEKKGVEALIA